MGEEVHAVRDRAVTLLENYVKSAGPGGVPKEAAFDMLRKNKLFPEDVLKVGLIVRLAHCSVQGEARQQYVHRSFLNGKKGKVAKSSNGRDPDLAETPQLNQISFDDVDSVELKFKKNAGQNTFKGNVKKVIVILGVLAVLTVSILVF